MTIFFCPCGQNLGVEANRADGPTRCPACGCLAPGSSRRDPDQPAGLDLTPVLEIPESVRLVPTMPALELRVVELPSSPSDPPPRPRPAPSMEDETYQLSEAEADAGANEIHRKVQRRATRRVLARAVRDLAQEPRSRRRWRLETHWYECLLYPVRAWPVVLGLAAAWATLTVILWAIVPTRWEFPEVGAYSPFLVIVFLLLGYTVAFFQATLTAANAGQAGFLAWPGRDLARAVRSGAQAVLAFLAGPVVPAVVAFLFWLHSGDLEVVDWLILWELGLVAVGYWALVLMAVRQRDRFRDVNPVAVVELVKKLGYRAPLTALLIAIPVVGHGFSTLDDLAALHRSGGVWLALTGRWAAQLAWVLFLLRWLGVSAFHARKAQPRGRDAALPAHLSKPPAPTARPVSAARSGGRGI